MEKALQRQKDKREKEKTRRELLAKLYFDFSKLVFAAFVLGGLSPLFQGKAEGEVSVLGIFIVVTLGVSVTIVFAYIGNKILK
jgi:hypothetical protein